MDKKAAAENLLAKLYDEIWRNREASTKIRNWCITVWMASLAFVLSPKSSLNPSQAHLFPLMPVLVFWILDALQHSFVEIHFQTARNIELALAREDTSSLDEEECYFHLNFEMISFGAKLKAFGKAMFVRETVAVFYLILLLSTVMIKTF